MEDDGELVAYLMQLFHYARLQRVNFEVQWEESASICWPEYRNTFAFGHIRAPGVKYTQYQVDSTGAIAAHRFMAIFDSLVTPFNTRWSEIRAADPYLGRQKRVRQFYNDVSQVLWAERYKAIANFQGQNQQNAQCLGVFGNMGMWTDELDNRPMKKERGLRYMSTSPGEIYILQNHQGREDGCIRHFRWTARQAYQRWKDKIPPQLGAALEKADTYTLFDFLQFVIPRTDYDPHKLFTDQGKPWASIYVSIPGHCIVERGGYYTYPRAGGRYLQAPEEWYGRGPAQQALPELKTLNAEKEAFLKTGVLAGDPAYLLPEDGLFDFKMQAGMNVYGGMSPEGKLLVGTVPTGNIQITKEMMDESRKIVDDAFLQSLFPLMFGEKGRQRTAMEVVEMAIQQGIFLSPLARQYTEYCAPMVERELDLLARMKKLPPIPPELREGGTEYETKFTSPLARAVDMPAIGGFMRTVEIATQVANSTGDRSVFYQFAFKRAIPEIAVDQRVPERWMSTPQEIAQQEKAAAQAAAEDRRVKSLPGEAAMAKAQAITAKAQAGQNIGGTLSGVPEGGMPQMPQ